MNNTLLDRISSFRKWKLWIAIPLIFLGVISLVIPILPGLLFLFIGLSFLNPSLADKIKIKVVEIYNNLNLGNNTAK